MRRVLLLLCLSLFVELEASAAVIQVPADQPTIQAGIDAAINGDTVLVSDGTYSGVGNRNISFGGKAIVVRSVNGAPVTIIDVDSTLNRGFIFSSGEDTLSILDGFTVTRAIADSGAGILISGGSPKILNCRFEKMGFTFDNCAGDDLSVHAPMGLGMAIVGNSHPILRRCLFTDIVKFPPKYYACQVFGAGLAVDAPATAEVEDCSFEDIYYIPWDGALGVALFDGSQGSSYLRCRFVRCGNENYHGSTYSMPVFLLNSNSRFDSCLFARNHLAVGFDSWIGSGSIWLSNSPATVSNCTFFGNESAWGFLPGTPGAMAILCTQSAATIDNCIIAFNRFYFPCYPDCVGANMPMIGTTPGDTVGPVITCTDIYWNLEGVGDWVGPLASQLGVNGNIRRNPYFCDTTNYDFHLAPNSPCLADSNSCGLLGAYAGNPSCPPGNCCIGRTGNIDCDPYDKVDISDLSAMITCLYIFPSSCNEHCCPGEENTDGDIAGGIDISDLSALIDYLYISFTPTAMCQ